MRPLKRFLAGFTLLSIVIAVMINGTNVRMLNPKGYIAEQQFYLIVFSTALLLAISIPVLIILYTIAWRYRDTNKKANYEPNAPSSKLFLASMWVIPSLFVLVLAVVMWPSTHRLEPKKPIAADAKPLRVQVVAMRWKWMFIYPEQNIATVNYVRIPVGTPVQFELTADEAPMSSFWVPNLGGQLYAMTGHVNRLNLIAEKPGEYPGVSAEINGAGFAGMKFVAHAVPDDQFNSWVEEVNYSEEDLDTGEYDKLLQPSENNPVAVYSSVDMTLYDRILAKYMGSHDHKPATYEAGH